MQTLIRKPLAWIPVVLPLLIIAMLGYALTTHGVTRDADEGTEAHLFQIWIVLEFILVSVFAARWLPRLPKQAGMIIALQLALSFIPCAVVFYFNL